MSRNIKLFVLAACMCLFTFVMTGCGVAQKTATAITSSTTASCTLAVGYDDEFLANYAKLAGVTKAKLIKEMKSQPGTTYARKTIDGVVYNMLYKTVKNASLKEVEQLLSESGYSNVCLTSNYFYASIVPEQSSSTSTTSMTVPEIEGISQEDIENAKFYMSTKITFKSSVKTTNGKLSNENKSVSWVIRDASKRRNFYASTVKAIRPCESASVANGKTYKVGRALNVTYAKNLVRMTLDGKTIKPGATVKKTGTRTLLIWSRTGKLSKVVFKVVK